MKHFVIFGTSIAFVTGSIALAETETPSDYEKSGASTALQSTTADRPPLVTLPEAHAPETDGQAPKASLDPGNGNWDPPPVTAPTTRH